MSDSQLDPQTSIPISRPRFVVGIGASAGGLEALEEFFDVLPPDTGMAFVVVQHQSPDSKSLLGEILARKSRMPIVKMDAPTAIEPDKVYIVQPRTELVIDRGLLVPVGRTGERGVSMPISRFFQSLGTAFRERAVAIILSGTGSDGTVGARELHAQGGLVLAQSPESAQFDGMPRSVIGTGFVEAELPPAELAQRLLILAANSPGQDLPLDEEPLPAPSGHEILPILSALNESHGTDFSCYKPATLGRRIERRRQLSGGLSLSEYALKLRADPAELDALYRDLLIGVTQFFRDPAAFEFLRERVIPSLVDSVSREEDLRVWVPACATGEEAYSIAILLLDELARQRRPANLKVFATDIHHESLRAAAEGSYPESSLSQVPAALRERYFIPCGEGQCCVVPELRQAVMFSAQNLLKDAPFSNLDLVSCRNLLIYFEPVAQARALSAFHSALKSSGVLFLGPSEATSEAGRGFESLNRRWRVFRKGGELRPVLQPSFEDSNPAGWHRKIAQSSSRLSRVYDQLLARFVPAGVLVNEQREAVHFFGDADRFFRAPAGRVTQDVLNLCEPTLRPVLSLALLGASSRKEPVHIRNVEAMSHGQRTLLDVVAEPISDRPGIGGFVLIRLQDAGGVQTGPAAGPALAPDEATRDRCRELEDELAASRRAQQELVDELETANEELQASNEELLAGNEELQSMNEELHSTNQELQSVNDRHEQKIRELAATTADLHNLMAATNSGILFVDEKNRIRLFTPGLAQLINLLPQDVGRPLRHLSSRIPSDDIFEAIDVVRATGCGSEKQVQLEDGTQFLRRIAPYQDSNQRSAGVVVSFTDITALQKAQQELRESEEKFRVMVDGTPSGLVMVDASGRIAHANPQTAAIFGHALEELVGQPLTVLLPESVRQGHGRMFADFISRPMARPMGKGRDLQGQRKDGTLIPLEIGLSPVRLRGKDFVLAFLTDITIRKQAEQALVESESRFRQMANDAPVMIWLGDTGGNHTFFNQTWLRLTGRSMEDECGTGWQDGLHPEDRENFLRVYRNATAHRSAFEMEHRLRRQDGAYAWIYTHGRPRLDVDGSLLGMIGCCTDITLQRQFADEQRRIEEKLQETAKLESLGVLAGGIAHDFNNILAGILGNVGLVQMELPGDSPLQEVLDTVHKASLRARDLCKQMLAYSGRSRFVLKHTELGWLVKDTTHLIKASISKAVHLDLHLAENLPSVEMDVPQIQQVIMNLVINASEAIGDGPGVIQVRTGLCRTLRDFDGLEIVAPQGAPGSHVFLEVEDDGCGIGLENLKRIFDPFYTTKFTGRGLGLAAVQGIVRGHKGALFIRSTEGKGTVFRMQLPWSAAPISEAPPVASPAALARGNGRILIVDDEELVRTTIRRILERFGYKCTTAVDGLEALGAYRAAPGDFQLVILDLTMPGMDGARTFHELQKIRGEVKVLLVSGFSENHVSARFGAEAPVGFLEKPIGAEELVRAVQTALNDPGTSPQPPSGYEPGASRRCS